MKDFLQLASDRFSVRAYKDTPVEKEKIDLILAAAKKAPTACNYQPQKIYAVIDGEKRKALAAVSPCTFDAPVIFVVGYDSTRSAKGRVCEGHDFGDTDAAIVCTHMMLEAADLGLGSCWVGYFKENDVRAALGIDETIRIRDLLPVGYPAESAVPSAMHNTCRADDDMITIL